MIIAHACLPTWSVPDVGSAITACSHLKPPMWATMRAARAGSLDGPASTLALSVVFQVQRSPDAMPVSAVS
jgi:hypothetical protein